MFNIQYLMSICALMCKGTNYLAIHKYPKKTIHSTITLHTPIIQFATSNYEILK